MSLDDVTRTRNFKKSIAQGTIHEAKLRKFLRVNQNFWTYLQKIRPVQKTCEQCQAGSWRYLHLVQEISRENLENRLRSTSVTPTS